MTEPRYAVLDGRAVRFTDSRAYWYIDGWRSIDAAEVAMNAKELNKLEFITRFPDLQDVPMTLFQEAGKVTAARS